ncbi:hypothetical protein [Polluticoccus soli]
MMNRRRTIYMGVAMSCLLIAGCKCNNNGKQGRENADSIADSSNMAEVPDSFSMEALKQKDSVSIFHNDTMAHELGRLSIRKETWAAAHLTDIDTVREDSRTTTVAIDNAFLKKYASILKASPNGNYLLDMGSDNKIDDPNTGALVDGDPENDVFIIDRQTGKRMALLQLGISGEVKHSHWLDDDKVALLCSLPSRDPNKSETYLYVYNAKDNVMKTYKF